MKFFGKVRKREREKVKQFFVCLWECVKIVVVVVVVAVNCKSSQRGDIAVVVTCVVCGRPSDRFWLTGTTVSGSSSFSLK